MRRVVSGLVGAAAAAFLMASGGPAAAQSAATPALALSCAGCHGQNGAGIGGTPRIAGTERGHFLELWSAFRADERPATIMNRIARGYTDAEAAALADYFATLR